MQLEVLTPEKQLFSGEVDAVKLPGTEGSFEVLNGHAPMIASLGKGDMRITAGKVHKHFEISAGFVEVLKNKVVVVVESGKDKA